MNRYSYLIVCLSTSLALPIVAQEVVTPQDTLKVKAKRLSDLPSVPARKVKKRTVEYSTVTISPSQHQRKEPLFSLLPKEEKKTGKPNFVTLGVGMHRNVEGQLLLQRKLNTKERWSAALLYDQQKPTVTILGKEVDLSQMTASAQLVYLRRERKLNWSVEGGFRLDNTSYLSAMGANEVKTTDQSASQATLKGKIYSTDKKLPLQFQGEVKYHYFSVPEFPQWKGYQEHQLAAKVNVVGVTNDAYKVGIKGAIHHLFYSLNGLRFRTALSLNPYFINEEEKYYVRLGAVVGLNNEGKTQLRFAPDIYATYRWQENASAFLSATGGFKVMDRAMLQEQCPYWGAFVQGRNAFEQFNLKLGSNWTNNEGLWLEALLGYKSTQDDAHLFINANSPLLQVKYARSKAFYYGAKIRYSYSDNLKVQLKANKYHWKKVLSKEAYIRKPDMKLEAEASYQILPTLQLLGNYAYTTWSSGSENAVSLLNMTAIYKLKPHTTVYAKVKNLLNQDFNFYPFYPSQGLTIIGGVQLSF